MQTAFSKGVAHDLEAAAHSLKGSSSNLGATTIAATCARIMQHAKSNDFTPVADLLKAVESDFGKVKELLLKELER